MIFIDGHFRVKIFLAKTFSKGGTDKFELNYKLEYDDLAGWRMSQHKNLHKHELINKNYLRP